MQRKTQRRWLWISIASAVLAAAAIVPLLVTADSGQVSFTATLYSDVIRFEADGTASLRVTIYDLAENELWNSGLIMGDFVDWDRTNAWGERLANGYYLYLARGWDAGERLVLNKAGRVVLLPGDQVELKAASSTLASPELSEVGQVEQLLQPMGLGDTGIFGQVGIGTASPGHPFQVTGSAGSTYIDFSGVRMGFSRPSANYIWAMSPGGYYCFGVNGTAPGLANASLILRPNGDVAMPNGNVGIGTSSPNEQLEITGNFRLPATTATTGIIYAGSARFIHNYGDRNTFIGEDAGNVSMTGTDNTAVGSSALKLNIWGYDNTAVGVDALRRSNTSHDNTAIGRGALYFCASGYNNTAVGTSALYATTSGNSNTAVGWVALNSLTSGARNTAVGDNALHSITTSFDNTAIGDGALLALTSGSRNIALGQMAGQFLDNGSDNILIGNDGGWSMSKYIYIGNVTDHTQTFIAGISGVIVSGGAQVYIKGTNQLGTLTSSERFKENIEDIGPTSDLLYDLRPVSFRYKPEIDPVGLTQYGLIAEEVAEVAADLVIADEDGEPYIVRYEQLVPLLLNELQELRASNEALLARLEALEQAVDSLKD